LGERWRRRGGVRWQVEEGGFFPPKTVNNKVTATWRGVKTGRQRDGAGSKELKGGTRLLPVGGRPRDSGMGGGGGTNYGTPRTPKQNSLIHTKTKGEKEGGGVTKKKHALQKNVKGKRKTWR